MEPLLLLIKAAEQKISSLQPLFLYPRLEFWLQLFCDEKWPVFAAFSLVNPSISSSYLKILDFEAQELAYPKPCGIHQFHHESVLVVADTAKQSQYFFFGKENRDAFRSF